MNSAGCRAGLSYMAGAEPSANRARTNERDARTGGGVSPPTHEAFGLAGVRGTARDEVFAHGLRLIVRDDPRRVLRFGRSRERLAKVRTNELATHSQFVRQFLRANGGGCCHVIPFRMSNASYVRSAQSVAYVRSFVCKVFVNIRSFVQSLTVTTIAPPCHPAEEEFRSASEFPGAKRAGRSFFCLQRSLV